MSLDYDRLKKNDEHTNWWTSYADLFMMLSVVFLLMYVAASLRSGAAGYMKQLESEKIAKENADLKEQIKVYSALKDQQLQQSNGAEQQVYSKLMDKLKLLREDAKQEKEELEKQAKENEEKEFALNQYQQIVRNIIDANILAKAQINRRENIIVKKEETLKEKEKVISAQDREIREKEDLITQNEAEIAAVNDKLQKRIAQLRREQKAAHISRKEAENRIARVKQESAAQIGELQAKSEEVETALRRARGNLASTQARLGETQARLGEAEEEKGALTEKLKKTREGYVAQIEQLRAEHESQLASEREAFQRNLKRQHLSASARARKLKEFAEQAERKAQGLEGELTGLNAKVRETDARLAGAEKEKNRYVAAVAGLQKENAAIQGDLARTRAMANARKEIAGSIGSAFKKAGIKANVDGQTGAVTLDFGEEYFDTGRAELKPNMRDKLNKFFPIYTDSLFNNPKSADKIANVEIIGFASSTYKGKYVNPNSLRPEDQQAVSYNLKLSFARANEIFKHIYGKNALTDAQKKKLLPMIKVVGRGYLPEGKSGAEIPQGLSEEKFCQMYNCKKAQKVIVKFSLKD